MTTLALFAFLADLPATALNYLSTVAIVCLVLTLVVLGVVTVLSRPPR